MLVDYLFFHFKKLPEKKNTTKDHRDSFLHYYVTNSRIKDFNVLFNGKSCFDLPVKNKEEAYEKNLNRNNNNDW